ncbi:Plastid lipid-associated protein/fibrillin conserved domain-containing protein [Dioscorea alata]|uniref:Plastid lipid-associated protein/fibrillin conserved domain-containing protein n=1 Tax=Dioscorea alata TaxID=55571 RepID=A0ACB7WN51_DIOAL|nr:Plastid lipid-associated protein/fibrillin conserved domain-containing protein [Dioscorea alata]
MVAALGSLPPLLSSARLPEGRRRFNHLGECGRSGGGGCWKAMVQPQTLQGASATYAKEMERVSAKESLFLSFKDAGGFKSLVGGKMTEMQQIDVNERIIDLERLNPTSRPTTSPFLQGRWNFEWVGANSPGSIAARILFERTPAILANLLGLDLLIQDGYAKATANLKILNSIDSKFILSAKLSIEGPLRLKAEYLEGHFEMPIVSEVALPGQLQAALGQASGTLQQLPAPVKDVFNNGLTVPLSGTFQRLFMISYLDEEILIMRDTLGAPDVLTRLEDPASLVSADSTFSEFEP